MKFRLTTATILYTFLLFAAIAPAAADTVSLAPVDSADEARCLEILKNNPLDRDALTKLIAIYGRSHQPEKLHYYTGILFDEYRDSGETDVRMTAYAYMGVSYLEIYEYGPAKECFNKVIRMADSSAHAGEKVDDEALIMAYNGLAVSYINESLNFEKAITYFHKVLQLMGPDYTVTGRGSIKSNLVLAYFFLENPAGMKYAEELYEEGTAAGNDRIKFMGAYGCAMMLYLKKDYDRAEKFIREAAASEYIYIDRAGVYNVYANILREKGMYIEAEKMYGKAAEASVSNSITGACTYLDYGEFLVRQGKYSRAVDILMKGVDMSEKIGSKINLFRFMALLSECYEKMGMDGRALDYYKEYKKYSDSTFSIEREREISDLQMKYEQAKYDARLSENEVLLERKNNMILSLSAAVLLVLVVLVLVWIMYREKNRMYRKIAGQYKSSIRREKLMAGMNEAPNPKISKDKSEELFSMLEMLMMKDRIFTDPSLTRDKVAEMMNTNRTYLSNVVNDRAGEPFGQYLNRYRVNYALQLIEEKGNGYPMKAIVAESGFHSPATFYKAFKDIVGMTPARYREQFSEKK